MGLLETDGLETLNYQQSKAFQKKFKKAGLTQLVLLLRKFQSEKKVFVRYPKFGFEIEGHLLKVITNKHGSNDYQLEFDKEYLLKAKTDGFSVQTEYGRWMLELVPSSPLEDYLYSGNLRHAINQVYKQLEELAKDDNKFLTSTLPPKFGTLSYANHYLPGLDHKQLAEANKVSGSQFMADAMINEHPRSLTSTSNVIERRGDKPFISVPIYPDTMTDLSRILPGEKEPGKIYLDSAMFGNGMTCLQVTVGTSDVSEARWLYDQLHIFTPIWLALSASSPFHKGTLLKTDTRWDILCQANDERNERERLPGGIQHLRYGPISMYISEDPRNFDCYNDERKTLNKWAWRFLYKKSKELGVSIDRKLLDHYAYLFVRDYLCIFERASHQEPSLDNTKLFEGIQSSNWNDVRFKPPPSFDSDIGWRVEFRSMEVQITPELNFLFSHSVQVLSRLLVKLKDEINFYIPMSKVTENFKRANTINAAVKQKFFFRTNLFETGHPIVEELTISEIFQGKGPFVGLLKIVDIFLTRSFDELIEESMYNKAKPGAQVQATFQFLADIAKGKVPTMATKIRRIINDHPLYNHDSLLSDALLDDLTSKLLDLQNNRDKSIYKIVNNYLRD